MQEMQFSNLSSNEEKDSEKPSFTCTSALRVALVSELTEICLNSTSGGTNLFLNDTNLDVLFRA
jgi:hypothetical protein